MRTWVLSSSRYTREEGGCQRRRRPLFLLLTDDEVWERFIGLGVGMGGRVMVEVNCFLSDGGRCKRAGH